MVTREAQRAAGLDALSRDGRVQCLACGNIYTATLPRTECLTCWPTETGPAVMSISVFDHVRVSDRLQ